MCLLVTRILQRYYVPGLFIFHLSKYTITFIFFSPSPLPAPFSQSEHCLCQPVDSVGNKAGRMGMPAPASPVSCVYADFCMSSLHLS